VTKNAKIILLGNPLPLAENPVRLAEELSMIDMISRGRLVSGFVRGGGQEQLAAGVSPAKDRNGNVLRKAFFDKVGFSLIWRA